MNAASPYRHPSNKTRDPESAASSSPILSSAATTSPSHYTSSQPTDARRDNDNVIHENDGGNEHDILEPNRFFLAGLGEGGDRRIFSSSFLLSPWISSTLSSLRTKCSHYCPTMRISSSTTATAGSSSTGSAAKKTCARQRKLLQNPLIQKLVSLTASLFFLFLLSKLMNPRILHDFLHWMEHHPLKGLLAYLILYPLHMVLILPGTPLVMGAAFVFKIQYGWIGGISFCTFITLVGSLAGSIICFYLGRHCFRTAVRRWSKKYPMFEPIDCAVSENGFQIMALIYLTPAVPLGPMSYMMGTTSMNVWDFAKAKIAALPMTAVYVYLGAATGTLLLEEEEGEQVGGEGGGGDGGSSELMEGQTGNLKKKNMGDISLSPMMVVAGILLSILILVVISVKMKHELQKVLDQQQRRKQNLDVSMEADEHDVEFMQGAMPSSPVSAKAGSQSGQIQKRVVSKKGRVGTAEGETSMQQQPQMQHAPPQQSLAHHHPQPQLPKQSQQHSHELTSSLLSLRPRAALESSINKQV